MINTEKINELFESSKTDKMNPYFELDLIIYEILSRREKHPKKRYFDSKSYKKSRKERKMRLKNSDGSLTKKDIDFIFKVQDGKCVCCGVKLNKNKRFSYHADHVISLISGGCNGVSNIQILCQMCNLKKGKLSIDYRTKAHLKKIAQYQQVMLFDVNEMSNNAFAGASNL